MRVNLARRWACLILGGALLMPYMMVGVLVGGLAGQGTATLMLPVELGVFVAVLPVVALTGLFLPVRGLAVSAAQGLLGAKVLTPPRQERRSWQERRRTAAWFTLHLAVGGVVSGCTLAVVPFTLFTLAQPFVPGPIDVLSLRVEAGAPEVGWALVGVVTLAGLVAMAAGSGALLARLAPVLLGPTPAERLAAAEEHARTLAERNRLARELHDSVGHALSVVTLQAAAAGRVLDRDPATARTALAAIEQSARSALDDLDHVLGVLRRGETPPGREEEAGPGPRAPQATLADLDALVAASGARVRHEAGDLSGVPAVVSREAYRIIQEALTNAIKYGRGQVRLSVGVHDGELRLEVRNPIGTRTAGPGGRGLTGMRERVRLLRGELEAGPAPAPADATPDATPDASPVGTAGEGWWRVAARLPLRSGA
ncbi:sensor histidine kinase [Nonomuraea sp. NPDC047897]|uniref:sensor histidine kinase n=1 Tax=Nonomuraea sp. NPDC047897 TaxID=3364346 RepID=UPI00371CD933